jgi:TonB family protein
LSSHAEPTFLLITPDRVDGRHLARIGLASVVVHILLLLVAIPISKIPSPRRVTDLRIRPDARRLTVTPLIAPPAALTQKEANKKPLSAEFNIASIAPRPENRVLPSPGAAATPKRAPAKKFTPSQLPGTPAPAVAIPDAPSLTVRGSTAPPPQALGSPNVPAPPQIQTQEKPKIAFEAPGSMTGTPNQTGVAPRIQAPKNSVDDAIRQVARGGGSRGLIVGDEEPNLGINPNSPSAPVPGKLGSSLELQSDPMGVDFKPYLIRVLSAVKRNWMAVIPESARLGRRGKVVIQFAISKDGAVPKLVIATPSGAEALDRAAVAGISASNPFPPLPAEFRGTVIRLQLNFMYNLQ